MTKEQIQSLIDRGYSDEQIMEYHTSGGASAESETPFGAKETARMALGQGLGFGFGDEIEAFARSVGSDRSYDEIRDEIRAKNDATREAHPWKSGFAEVLGGALTGGAGAAKGLAGAGARGLLRNAARGAGTGAGMGAVQGVGAGRGGFEDQALSGLAGAGIGGALGGIATPALAGFARRGGRGQTANILDERMSGATPEQVAGRVEQLGPGAMVADTSPQMRGMTQYLGNKPGPGQALQTTLETRELGKGGTIEDIVRRATGIEGDPRAMEAAARSARHDVAKVDYDELLRRTIVPTADMAEELKLNPGAARKALQSTRLDRKNAGMPWDVSEDELRSTAGYWDHFGRELRNKATSSTGQVKPNGVPLLQAKDRIDTDLNAATGGALSEVRGRYAQASEGLDAYKQAEKFLTLDADDAVDMIRGLDNEQKQLYTAGVTRSLLRQVENSPATADSAWNAIKKPATVKKMKALIGEEGYAQWRKSMEGVMAQSKTYKDTNTGPRTAPMLIQQGDMENASSVAGSAMQGNFLDAARNAAGIMKKRQGIPDPVAEALMRAITAKGGGTADILRGILEPPVGRGGVAAAGLLGPGATQGLLGARPER